VSSRFTQLDPPIPVWCVDKGAGIAHGIIDYGPEHHLYWVVFLDGDGSCWTLPNPKIRGQHNASLGRPASR
jgi:hypothetical protein